MKGVWDGLRGPAVMLLVFALLFSGALKLLNYVDAASEETQLTMVREAVQNAAVMCYAVEGAYPQNLQYLKDNYGLAYDETRFFVFYDSFAANVVPEIRVQVKGGLAHEAVE